MRYDDDLTEAGEAARDHAELYGLPWPPHEDDCACEDCGERRAEDAAHRDERIVAEGLRELASIGRAVVK